MSIAKRPYELSVWEDVWNNGAFTEKRIAIIGSNTMTSQYRAIEPKFKRNVNGTNELTFKMYYRYQDNITGEIIENPFITYLSNERKLKLKYKNKWYDLLIKDIKKDSTNKIYTYTATDQYIVELSKNGYNVTLDAELQNNVGTPIELTTAVLNGTDWEVDGEIIPQTTTEALIKLTLNKKIIAKQLLDSATTHPIEGNDVEIEIGKIIYAFYSCCTSKPFRFQFIYLDSYQPDEEGIISTKNSQYYIDNINYSEVLNTVYFIPDFTKEPSLSTEYRGKKYVFSQKTKFNKVLNTYAQAFSDGTEEGCWRTTETKFISPNLIKNYVTNNLFKSTSGWTGSYIAASGAYANQSADYAASCEVKTDPSVLDALLNNSFSENPDIIEYRPYISLNFPTTNNAVTSTVVNSGFYDIRTSIENLAAGQKFVLLFEPKTASSFSVDVGVKNFSISDGHYITNTSTILSFGVFDPDSTRSITIDGHVYYYAIANVNSSYTWTEAEFQANKVQIFITPASYVATTVEFYDFQIFPYVEHAATGRDFMIPADGAEGAIKKIVTYKYYKESENASVTDKEKYKFFKSYENTDVSGYIPAFYSHAEKIKAVTIKQSNRFNAIQSICEAFGCWADFQVSHDSSTGAITGKKVYFQNYIGKDNFAGFRAGINLKSTQRTNSSKQIVTKLIVPDNTNEHAENGTCSISRSTVNETGENYIYNFRYYVQQGLLSEELLNEILYGDAIVQGGYYPKLKELNNLMLQDSDSISKYYLPMLQAEAEVTLAENGRLAAQDEYETAAASFRRLVGIDHTKIGEVYSKNADGKYVDANGDELNDQGYLTKLGEAYCAWAMYTNKLNVAKNNLSDLEALYNVFVNQLNARAEEKAILNKNFYTKFYRFIQEGTWKDESCVDNTLYYIDAKSTMYNSCFPQVTYTFNVMEVAQLEDYKDFSFDLGDKTFAEDPEFFGYINGIPYREEVIISEVTYSLDEPDKDLIKVQNFKNQFQDLFQKITASVQSLSYASGAYDRAADDATASIIEQASKLQPPLLNSNLTWRNASEQSVEIGESGIVITDLEVPSDKIRLVGGAILLPKTNNHGQEWYPLLTAQGINAKAITSGQLDTAILQIMNGEEPYFRWDALGLTSYAFNDSIEGRGDQKINYRKGVRFDRFGIYGFNEKDGVNWHPTSGEEVRTNAQFALTWDGLWLNLGFAKYSECYVYDSKLDEYVVKKFETPIQHKSTAIIGKTSEYIYNSWSNMGIPYYDIDDLTKDNFVKILSIGSNKDKEQLAIYDDGTLVARNVKLEGSVEWAASALPAGNIYSSSKEAKCPENGTKLSSFPESVSEPSLWHREKTDMDEYYCHTDNAGATWVGPSMIDGPENDQIELMRFYYSTNTYEIPDTPTSGVEEIPTGWSIEEPTIDSELKYCYISTCIKTTKYTSLRDVASITYSGWTNPELWGAYGGENIPPYVYATFVKLTNNTASQGSFYDENGKYYINANYIQTGFLTVGDDPLHPIFQAGWDGEPSVIIGGFEVTESYIASNGKTSLNSGTGVYVGTSGIGLGSNFYVTSAGALTSTLGFIGGWTISSGKLSSGKVYLYSEGPESNRTINGYETDTWRFFVQSSTDDKQGTFGVTADGALYASNANIAGTITATGGTIGGFTISGEIDYVYLGYGNIGESNSIFLIPDTQYCLFNAPAIAGQKEKMPWVFTAGNNFGITNEGYLYASNANIAGTINATGGTIGSSTNDGWLQINIETTITGTNPNKKEEEAGDVTSTMKETYFRRGILDDVLASARWGFENNHFYLGRGGLIISNPDLTATGLQQDSTDTEYYGVRISTSGISVAGSNGIRAVPSSSMTTIRGNGFAIRRSKDSNRVVIQNNYSPLFNLTYGQDVSSTNNVFDITYYHSSGGSEWVNLNVDSPSAYARLLGTWKVVNNLTIEGSGIIDTSDPRAKNSITNFSNAYSTLFDALVPRIFKYNNGTSGRYHSGYVTTEVYDAILAAGLTTQDFAGYVDGKDISEYEGLRYSEFIALNTWQIQLLKPRMTAAEEKIAALEDEIEQLKTELENLQKS